MGRGTGGALKNPGNVAILCLAATALIALGANQSAFVAPLPATPAVPPRRTFADVPVSHPFWVYIERMAARDAMPGFPCGGAGEPCDALRRPYFRPNAALTLGDLADAISMTYNYRETPQSQTFADVPPDAPHYRALEQFGRRVIIVGIACGRPGLPCDAAHRAYAQPDQGVDRFTLAAVLAAVHPGESDPSGQTFRDVAPGAYYYSAVQRLASRGVLSGYSCGGPDEPCDTDYHRYFRGLQATDRSQLARTLAVDQGYSEFPGLVTATPHVTPPGN